MKIAPVPIIENEQTKKLVGIVTDRDLKSTKAEEVTTRNVATRISEDDLQKALDAMCGHKLRRIPVVDNNIAWIPTHSATLLRLPARRITTKAS